MSDLDPRREKALRLCFRLPPAQTMLARTSTITNAFVSALIPRVHPTVDEIDEALTVLGLDPFNLTCAYCGSAYDTWDHLRPLVTDRKPTGFITEIANLVPSCGRCNSSKGKSHWKAWMFGRAKGSPLVRQVADLDARASRLFAYETWREPVRLDFPTVLGDGEWKHYWSLCDAVVADLQAAQTVADRLQGAIAIALRNYRTTEKSPPAFLSGDASKSAAEEAVQGQ